MYYGPGDPTFDRITAGYHSKGGTPDGLKRLYAGLGLPLEPGTPSSGLPSQAARPHEEEQAEAPNFNFQLDEVADYVLHESILFHAFIVP
jgi:hypothetical protein